MIKQVEKKGGFDKMYKTKHNFVYKKRAPLPVTHLLTHFCPPDLSCETFQGV